MAADDETPVSDVLKDRAMRAAKSKLGFQMKMDSGDWRGKGTEYSSQKDAGRVSQKIEDSVMGRAKYDDWIAR